jgi:hypothetical protein
VNARHYAAPIFRGSAQATCTVFPAGPVDADHRLGLVRAGHGSSAAKPSLPECGRGLMLVDHLVSEWGSYRKADGKVVWLCHGHGKGLLCRKGF